MKKIIQSNKTFIRHNLFSYFVIVFNILASVYSVRENISVLGSDQYGIWILLLNTLGILGLLNFGFSSVAIFKFNEYKEKNTLQQFFSGNLYVLICQVVITLVFFVLIQFSVSYIVRDEHLRAVLRQLLLLALPGLLLNVVGTYFEAILFYNLKFIYFRNIQEMARLGIANLLYVVGLTLFQDIIVLPIVYSLVSLCTFLYALYKFISVQNIKIDLNELNSGYLFQNWRNGLSFWVLGFSAFIISQTDVFFVSSFKGDIRLVTVYSQSFRLQDIALKFIKKISEIKAPKVLSLYKAGSHKSVVNIFEKLLIINILLSSLVCILIVIWGKDVLDIWLKGKVEFDQLLITVLSFMCITSSIHWVFWNFCTITEQQERVKYMSIIEIFLNLILSYVLIQILGLVGLGIASMISNSITIIYMYLLFRKYRRSHLGLA